MIKILWYIIIVYISQIWIKDSYIACLNELVWQKKTVITKLDENLSKSTFRVHCTSLLPRSPSLYDDPTEVRFRAWVWTFSKWKVCGSPEQEIISYLEVTFNECTFLGFLHMVRCTLGRPLQHVNVTWCCEGKISGDSLNHHLSLLAWNWSLLLSRCTSDSLG